MRPNTLFRKKAEQQSRAVAEQVSDSEVGAPCEKGRLTMGDEKDDGSRAAGNDTLAPSIAKETGITEDQARELIRMIGTDRNSLLREGRQLLRQRLR